MKSIYKLTLLILLSLFSQSANAFDLKDLVGKAAEKATSSANGSKLGDLLGNVISSDKISIPDIAGSYSYAKPAVSFKSDNLLKKAGGTAISATVESKLAPYYKTAGIDKMTLVINADSTFQMKVRGLTLKGNIIAAPQGSGANFTMKFKALGKINVGSLNTYVVKSANKNIALTFDVSKLVSLLQKVGGVVNISSLNAITGLLKEYDGICAGFTLTTQK